MDTTESNRNLVVWRSPFVLWVIVIPLAAVLAFSYKGVLAHLVHAWNVTEEYSYGYIIPFITLFLIWQRKDLIGRIEFTGSWGGIILILLGIGLLLLGKGGGFQHTLLYSLLVLISGLTLAYLGKEGFRKVRTPLLLLFFMVPLPDFLFKHLSSFMQSISSQIGVAFIRLLGISVYLEGNVIYLRQMQLQVAEACSGLRYLFPLMTLALISACFFRAPFWKRTILFLSSIPIAIFLNSFRIGLIGITVEYLGNSMAEGFLHDFEGWSVFLACTALLVLEMWLMARFATERKPLREVFGLEFPELSQADITIKKRPLPQSFGLAAILVLVTALLAEVVPERSEHPPARKDFAEFPLQLGEWSGTSAKLDQIILDTLKLTDYLLIDYRDKYSNSLNMYVAYYASQSEGNTIHSPKDCLPGGGWEIVRFAEWNLDGVAIHGRPMRVNRALIQKGGVMQIAYYWYQDRERVLTNELAARLFIPWDALTRNRTDGALVRLVTPLKKGQGEAEAEADADERLTAFLRLVTEILPAFVPR